LRDGGRAKMAAVGNYGSEEKWRARAGDGDQERAEAKGKEEKTREAAAERILSCWGTESRRCWTSERDREKGRRDDSRDIRRRARKKRKEKRPIYPLNLPLQLRIRPIR
jgi:hypothetical protein